MTVRSALLRLVSSDYAPMPRSGRSFPRPWKSWKRRPIRLAAGPLTPSVWWLLAALGWAIFGKVDIVAVASGKIISHMRTQVVQPFETASVNVDSGQSRTAVSVPAIR